MYKYNYFGGTRMLQGINIDEIKNYNSSLKQYREKAASLKAQIEYTNQELDNLCKELTAELGKEVTRENIEQIYTEEVTKIQSTLQSGNAVLAKIASEGQSASVAQTPVAPQVTPQAQPVAPQVAPVAPQVTPVAPAPVSQAPAGTLPGGQVAGSVFGGGAQSPQLPPLFNLN